MNYSGKVPERKSTKTDWYPRQNSVGNVGAVLHTGLEKAWNVVF